MMQSQTRHDVAFYDDRSHLEECVAQYTIDGLRADETIVLILAGRSLHTITSSFSSHDFAVAELVANGRVALFDVDDTFARIDGPAGLDWAAVTSLANDVIDNCVQAGTPRKTLR